MTTHATTQPIEAFREARTTLLDTFLGAVSGLEGSVLVFEQEHQRRLAAAQRDAASAHAEAAGYRTQLARQADALETAAAHVCPSAGGETEQAALPAPAAADEEAEAEIARLRGELAGAEGTIRQLREDLAEATAKAERLEREQPEDAAGTEALEAEHAAQLAAIAAGFEARVQDNHRAARAAAHAEAAGIVEALAADNPALPLSEAAELFAEAFEADPGTAHEPAAAGEAAEPAQDEAPAEWPEEPAPVPAAQPAPEFEDFFAEAAPAPMTQAMPDLHAGGTQDDTAPDPFAEEEPFFDEATPAPVPAAAPKPGFGLFGRKKEETPA